MSRWIGSGSIACRTARPVEPRIELLSTVTTRVALPQWLSCACISCALSTVTSVQTVVTRVWCVDEMLKFCNSIRRKKIKNVSRFLNGF